jgi:hypothetical protein
MGKALFFKVIDIGWRGVCVGAAYIVGVMLGGMVLGMLGLIPSSAGGSSVSLGWIFVAGIVVGLTLGPIARQMAVSRWQHLLIWSSIIFFNLASVMIEGAFFAPALVPMPIWVLALQQALAALITGAAITVLFAPARAAGHPGLVGQTRMWYDWGWRLTVSVLSYMVFYLVFGAINYTLVTGPYYETHAGGLTVPPAQLIWSIEFVRSVLIVISVLLFLRAWQGSRRSALILTGLILFMVGGIAPLLFQVSALPLGLLTASAVEIFFQNFLTGVVAAALLGTPARAAARLA